MMQALNVVLFWVAYIAAFVIQCKWYRNLELINEIKSPDGREYTEWYRRALPWVIGSWALIATEMLFFAPVPLGAYDGVIAAIVAAISFAWNIYTWGSDMSGDASQTSSAHASRFCSNLMFASTGVMVVFGIVSALRLCGFTFNIPAM